MKLKAFDSKKPFVTIFGSHAVMVDGEECQVAYKQGNVLYDHTQKPLCTEGPAPKLTPEQEEVRQETEAQMRDRIRDEVRAQLEAEMATRRAPDPADELVGRTRRSSGKGKKVSALDKV